MPTFCSLTQFLQAYSGSPFRPLSVRIIDGNLIFSGFAHPCIRTTATAAPKPCAAMHAHASFPLSSLPPMYDVLRSQCGLTDGRASSARFADRIHSTSVHSADCSASAAALAAP